MNVINSQGYSKTVKGLYLTHDCSFTGLDNYGCKRPVLQKLEGSIVRRFDSTLSASKEFGVSDSAVSRWCRGAKARNGFQWEYETT